MIPVPPLLTPLPLPPGWTRLVFTLKSGAETWLDLPTDKRAVLLADLMKAWTHRRVQTITAPDGPAPHFFIDTGEIAVLRIFSVPPAA